MICHMRMGPKGAISLHAGGAHGDHPNGYSTSNGSRRPARELGSPARGHVSRMGQ